MGPQAQTTTNVNLARQSGAFMPPHVAITIQEAFQPVDPYDLWVTRYENHRPYSAFFNAVDMILRQVYRHVLLRIPSMYFSRVSRVFRTARISGKDIQDMRGTGELDATPQMVRFRDLWVDFIDQLIKEWKTLNVIAALLLSAILTLLQIEVANQPITRTAAFLSLVDALMSLIYGCLFIIRFGTMKSKWKAASFAEVMNKTRTSIWWNALVMLSLPAVWLSWSLIFFCLAIMAFLWTDGDDGQNTGILLHNPGKLQLGARIAVSIIFVAGLLYLFLVVRTFRFELYKDKMDYDTSSEIGQGIRNKARKIINTLKSLPTKDESQEPIPADDEDEWFVQPVRSEAESQRSSLQMNQYPWNSSPVIPNGVPPTVHFVDPRRLSSSTRHTDNVSLHQFEALNGHLMSSVASPYTDVPQPAPLPELLVAQPPIPMQPLSVPQVDTELQSVVEKDGHNEESGTGSSTGVHIFVQGPLDTD